MTAIGRPFNLRSLRKSTLEVSFSMTLSRFTLIASLIALAGFLALPAGYAGGISDGAITYTKDVAPILLKNCAECHRPGEAAPMSLLSYKETRPWAVSIREKVLNKEMPPWHADPTFGHFKNDRRLTNAEISTIKTWVDTGAKEGDPSLMPPAPQFVSGWRIGKPDLVLNMPTEFTVEASGPDEYHVFEIDPGFTEDRYITMAEARPGNRRVVHHILAFIKPATEPGKASQPLTREETARFEQDFILRQEGFLMRMKPDVPVYDNGCETASGGNGSRRDGSGMSGAPMPLVAFAPGMDEGAWPAGSAKRIPAGSRILLQVHYSNRSGKVEIDRSMLGFIFAKTPPAKEVHSRIIGNVYFKIPAGAENHRVGACWTAPEDVTLLQMTPHMHVRGKAMQISAVYPDGRSEVLLNVPRYDFAWQTHYRFTKPIRLPRGGKLLMTGAFDNSAKNKHNPDPTKEVRFGEPTYDEMFAALIEYTFDRATQAGVKIPSSN